MVLLALALLHGGPLSAPAHAQGTLSAIEADVDQIARRARPSLVTIIAERDIVAHGPGAAAPKRTHRRVGSGVAVEDNLVLTTASVVLGAQNAYVLTDNGLQVEAQIVGLDPVFNIALLRVPGLELPPIRFAARAPQLGDWVIALGSSYGMAPTQSVGNIAYRFTEPRTSLLQLTNEVYPGNSGGAALNTRGELVGLVQGELGAPEAPGRGNDGERRPGGMSFAIPVEDIVPVVDAMRREGRVRHGFLGVSTRNAAVDSDTQPGIKVPIGAQVEAVAAGGPAARLGIEKGDLIVAFDGDRVEYSEQLARWVAATRPGTVVNLVWAHQDLQRTGKVALGESPSVIPDWMRPDDDSTPATNVQSAANAPSASRIAELEDQIRKLSRELERLKGSSDSAR